MSTFAVQWLESVRKDGKLKFFKLLKDEVSPFDLFYEEMIKDAKHKKDILHILTMMDYMAEKDEKLPKEKVNSIKEGDKVIGIELKKNDLRVYCIKQEPDVFVVLGGYKKNQVKDIKYLKRLLKENKDLIQVLQRAKPK